MVASYTHTHTTMAGISTSITQTIFAPVPAAARTGGKQKQGGEGENSILSFEITE